MWFRTTGQLQSDSPKLVNAMKLRRLEPGLRDQRTNLHILLGRIAWIFGDFSEAARHWSITARANSPRWSPRARMGVADVRMIVGIDPHPAGCTSPAFITVHQRSDVAIGSPPTQSAWQRHNRDGTAADVYRDDNHMAAKLMLKAGRGKELAATYDGPAGLLSLRPNGSVRADQLHEAAVVALALRQAGRSGDADLLLAQAASTIATVYRQQAIPFALDADVAAIWAVQSRRDQALSMLERAMRRGWTDSANTDLPDIEDEPAFASLRGQARFERVRASFAAHLSRERTETMRLRL